MHKIGIMPAVLMTMPGLIERLALLHKKSYIEANRSIIFFSSFFVSIMNQFCSSGDVIFQFSKSKGPFKTFFISAVGIL